MRRGISGGQKKRVTTGLFFRKKKKSKNMLRIGIVSALNDAETI